MLFNNILYIREIRLSVVVHNVYVRLSETNDRIAKKARKTLVGGEEEMQRMSTVPLLYSTDENNKSESCAQL